jgi:hypothetical protein
MRRAVQAKSMHPSWAPPRFGVSGFPLFVLSTLIIAPEPQIPRAFFNFFSFSFPSLLDVQRPPIGAVSAASAPRSARPPSASCQTPPPVLCLSFVSYFHAAVTVSGPILNVAGRIDAALRGWIVNRAKGAIARATSERGLCRVAAAVPPSRRGIAWGCSRPMPAGRR